MINNAQNLEEVRGLVDLKFWNNLCKLLKIKNKPLMIHYGQTGSDNILIKAFMNSSNIIAEEDSDIDDEDN
jgi:hypothetical protein